mmetsp:Transcript_3032/g.11625  ORF Transcript_3032/g.11625 Transcript_3032/m.11625 type:complete len:156 (+) Transcript_3032:625-1092(+)
MTSLAPARARTLRDARLFASKCPLPLDENGERPRPNDDDIGPKRMSRRYHAFVSFRDERCFARSRRSRRGMPRGSSWTVVPMGQTCTFWTLRRSTRSAAADRRYDRELVSRLQRGVGLARAVDVGLVQREHGGEKDGLELRVELEQTRARRGDGR